MQHKSFTGGRLMKIVVASVAIAACMVSAPHAAKAEASTLGSVDVAKLQSGYAKLADMQNKVKAIGDDLNRRFKIQSGYDMLTLDEQQQLEALLAKPTRTDVENAKVNDLENKSSHDSQTLAALQQKPPAQLTDADKGQLNALTSQHQSGTQALQSISDQYQDQFNAQQTKIQNDFTDQVKAAIAAVAKEKGLSVIFDANVAIYTSNDITDDVLKRLNK